MNAPLQLPGMGAVQPGTPVIPVVVPPQPHNLNIEVAHIPEAKMVRIVCHRDSGIDFIFLPPDLAIEIANNIKSAANAAKAGIHIASSMKEAGK